MYKIAAVLIQVSNSISLFIAKENGFSYNVVVSRILVVFWTHTAWKGHYRGTIEKLKIYYIYKKRKSFVRFIAA